MLQSPPLPPLSLNDLNRKRFIHHHHQPPLSISTNFSSNSPSPSSPAAKLPRSPYISSRQLHTASPLPCPKSSSHSIASQTIEDVLAPGDIVGDGFFLQGEPIRLVSNGATTHDHREPAHELEVIKQLGTGSYAVVYLVQEVLSRPVPSEDGHMSTIGLMELDSSRPSASPHIVYGRKYAIKCLSKANLDEEALALQMSEVKIFHFIVPSRPIIHLVIFRSPFISHCIYTPTLSLFIALFKPQPFCSSFSNTSLARIFFTFWNRPVTIMISNPPSLLLIHPPLLVCFPTCILPNCSPALVSVLSHPCSVKCAMPSQLVMHNRSSTVTSNQRTLLSLTEPSPPPMVA